MRQQLTGPYSAELNCLYLFLGGKSDDSLLFDVCFSKLQLEMAMASFMLPKGPISRLISYHVETTILEKSKVRSEFAHVNSQPAAEVGEPLELLRDWFCIRRVPN